MGLFRAPEVAIAPPEDCGQAWVRVYNPSTGKLLASKQMTTKCLVIGSSTKQAHILDTHTSVYSQHCAVVCTTKGFSIFPLGGETRLRNNSDFDFLPKRVTAHEDDGNAERRRKEKVEEELAQTKAKLERDRLDKVKEFYMNEEFTSAVLPVELMPKIEAEQEEEGQLLVEGGKKVSIDVNKSALKLGSSKYVYFIDLVQWTTPTAGGGGVSSSSSSSSSSSHRHDSDRRSRRSRSRSHSSRSISRGRDRDRDRDRDREKGSSANKRGDRSGHRRDRAGDRDRESAMRSSDARRRSRSRTRSRSRSAGSAGRYGGGGGSGSSSSRRRNERDFRTSKDKRDSDDHHHHHGGSSSSSGGRKRSLVDYGDDD